MKIVGICPYPYTIGLRDSSRETVWYRVKKGALKGFKVGDEVEVRGVIHVNNNLVLTGLKKADEYPAPTVRDIVEAIERSGARLAYHKTEKNFVLVGENELLNRNERLVKLPKE